MTREASLAAWDGRVAEDGARAHDGGVVTVVAPDRPDEKARVFEVGPRGSSSTRERVLPEVRLFNEVARWDAVPATGPQAVIDAACEALVDGLDSPSLRELAGMSSRDRRDEVEPVVTHTLSELGVPRAGDLPLGYQVAAGGGIEPRPGTDTLRLEVAPVADNPAAEPDAGFGDFEVRVFVNDVEMTSPAQDWGWTPTTCSSPPTSSGRPPTPPVPRSRAAPAACTGAA